ncbi:MAG: hypothetical protein ACJ8AI_21565 [Rhodopila sp.]
MAAWSINITPGSKPHDCAVFISANQPTAPVGTLYADVGDVVSWNNATQMTHTISVFVGSGVSGVVTPNHQTAAFVIPDGATQYFCTEHPDEKGVILAGSANTPQV